MTITTESVKDDSRLEPLPKVQSAFIVMSDKGTCHAVFGGTCPLLAQALRQASDLYPDDVQRRESALTPMGQDIYKVSRSYLMMIRGLFQFLDRYELEQLPDQWPDTFSYEIVVSS